MLFPKFLPALLISALAIFATLNLNTANAEKGTQTELIAEPSNTGGGQVCGGIAGLQCPAGESCRIKEKYPDAMGLCMQQRRRRIRRVAKSQVDASDSNELCGGAEGLRCPPGRVCRFTRFKAAGDSSHGRCVQVED